MKTESEIEKLLRNIISRVFKIPEESLPVNPGQNEIEKWDSMGHLILIMEIESVFSIKLNSEIIPELSSFQLLKKAIMDING